MSVSFIIVSCIPIGWDYGFKRKNIEVYMIKLLRLLPLLLLSMNCYAQSIKIDVVTNPMRATTGQTVSVTKTYVNQLAKRPPIIIKASCEYTDVTGEQITVETQASIEIVQPVKINRIFATVPLNSTYVAGSAKLGDTPAPPLTTTPGQLIWPVAVTLNEGEKLTVFYQFQVK